MDRSSRSADSRDALQQLDDDRRGATTGPAIAETPPFGIGGVRSPVPGHMRPRASVAAVCRQASRPAAGEVPSLAGPGRAALVLRAFPSRRSGGDAGLVPARCRRVSRALGAGRRSRNVHHDIMLTTRPACGSVELQVGGPVHVLTGLDTRQSGSATASACSRRDRARGRSARSRCRLAWGRAPEYPTYSTGGGSRADSTPRASPSSLPKHEHPSAGGEGDATSASMYVRTPLPYKGKVAAPECIITHRPRRRESDAGGGAGGHG